MARLLRHFERSGHFCHSALEGKGTGLDAAGLEFLMSMGEEWYARRKRDRTLKAGDRIAVLGHGKAVVESVNEKEVHAVLWNRTVPRIQRNGIVWDESNMPWETPS